MAQINKPTDYFNTVLYTGNGGTQSITGVNFQPDWVWIKNRPDIREHQIYDSIRGVTKVIGSDRTSAEATVSNGLTAFGSDGFTVGSDANVNDSGDSHVSWNWLAGGTAVSNTDGSITSTVSANTTSGFSIVSYTGTGSAGTIGHGLGVAPACIIFKNRDAVVDWFVYHQSTGNSNRTKLNTNDTSLASSFINNTTPSSTVFNTDGGGATGTNGNNFIAYCFAEKKGFSKFGSYTGNGSDNGTFVYLGFKPAFVMVKNTVQNARNWTIIDNKRNTFNPETQWLYPNTSDVELDASSYPVDFVSNGFKIRTGAGSYFNTANENYIYMAFAEQPLVGTNNIPTTAR